MQWKQQQQQKTKQKTKTEKQKNAYNMPKNKVTYKRD